MPLLYLEKEQLLSSDIVILEGILPLFILAICLYLFHDSTLMPSVCLSHPFSCMPSICQSLSFFSWVPHVTVGPCSCALPHSILKHAPLCPPFLSLMLFSSILFHAGSLTPSVCLPHLFFTPAPLCPLFVYCILQLDMACLGVLLASTSGSQASTC